MAKSAHIMGPIWAGHTFDVASGGEGRFLGHGSFLMRKRRKVVRRSGERVFGFAAAAKARARADGSFLLPWCRNYILTCALSITEGVMTNKLRIELKEGDVVC